MEHILEIKNIKKAYDGFTLQSLSMDIPKGCIVGFVGENGAGKTTTIKAIMDMISLDEGSITIFGKDSKKDGKQIRQEIGAVLAESSFPEYMTPKQIAKVLSSMYQQWDDHLYQSYLTQFQLPAEKQIKTYSKGMRMKLNIAMALAHHPKLLIMDEATSGLDPIVREEILDVFLDFIQDEEHAVFLSSHITSDIEKVADYIAFLHQGRLVLYEEKDTILSQYGILKTTAEKFALLQPCDYVNYRKSNYSLEILVKDQEDIKRRFPKEIVDHASLEDIMLFTVKGEVTC